MKARVIIVDDHPIFRMGMAELLNQEDDFIVCGLAEDIAGARKVIQQYSPDLAIIDITLAGENGLDLVKELSGDKNPLPILVLSMHDEQVWAERAIRAGAIDDSWGTMSENALRGILRHTHRNGLVDQAMAQCGGVGDYPCIFGPSNYAQGPTLALFSLVRQRFSAKQGRRQACISIIRRSGNASTVLQTLNN